MIAGDSRNSKKVIVRGGSQGVLASTLSIAPVDGVTGPSISNAVLFNFQLPEKVFWNRKVMLIESYVTVKSC